MSVSDYIEKAQKAKEELREEFKRKDDEIAEQLRKDLDFNPDIDAIIEAIYCILKMGYIELKINPYISYPEIGFSSISPLYKKISREDIIKKVNIMAEIDGLTLKSSSTGIFLRKIKEDQE